jgi:hypothetical protein
MKQYAYILVRMDLTNTQRVVQSSHVAFELAQHHRLDYHPSMVLIGIKNLSRLEKEVDRLEGLGFIVTKFYEPLVNNELTAIGVLAAGADRDKLRRYQLLTDISFYPAKLQPEIKLKNCTHYKTKPAYYETLKFEFTPGLVCAQCGVNVPGSISEEQKVELYKQWHKDLFDGEVELSLTELTNKKDGFNI